MHRAEELCQATNHAHIVPSILEGRNFDDVSPRPCPLHEALSLGRCCWSSRNLQPETDCMTRQAKVAGEAIDPMDFVYLHPGLK